MINTQKRYGHTAKKMVSLTHEGRAQIQQFADAHGLNFSATIESLALIGMKADLTQLLVPLLRETVDKALQRNFNRLAKLSLIGAAEGVMTHDLITMILLQLVRQQAEMNPDSFEEKMLVTHDPHNAHDTRVRELYKAMRQTARQRQQRVLKRPLTDLIQQLAADETATEVSDEG